MKSMHGDLDRPVQMMWARPNRSHVNGPVHCDVTRPFRGDVKAPMDDDVGEASAY